MSVNERLERVEASLDKFEETTGLRACVVDGGEEVERLLTLHAQDLRKLSASECGESAYLLRKFAFNLQRALNKEQARARWADDNVRRITAPLLQQVFGYSYEERRWNAVPLDDAAIKFERIREYSQLRVERIQYLATRASEMARDLVELQITKRGEH